MTNTEKIRFVRLDKFGLSAKRLKEMFGLTDQGVYAARTSNWYELIAETMKGEFDEEPRNLCSEK